MSKLIAYFKSIKLSKRGKTAIFIAVVLALLIFFPYEVIESRLLKNHKSKEEDTVSTTQSPIKADRLLLLVNDDFPVPEDFVPILDELENDFKLDHLAAPKLEEMMKAAESDGVDLWVVSAYRSYQKQKEIFDIQMNAYINVGYSEETAHAETSKYIAIPGSSEHYTGFAVDLNSLEERFEGTDAFRWLDANAASYGFILRYPKDKTHITLIEYEPWHYRYIGKSHAVKIKEENWCFEEYLSFLEGK